MNLRGENDSKQSDEFQASSTRLDIALKVSSSERRRVVLLMESAQISPCGFICEREES